MIRGGACFICCKTSTTNCSKCRDVFYCSRECQLADWKRHKIDCETVHKFALRDLSQKYGGCQRGLVMRTPAKAGEVLYEKKPYLFMSGMMKASDPEETERILHLDKCEHRAVGGRDGNTDLCMELCILLLIHDQRRARAILKQCEKTPAPRKLHSPPHEVVYQDLLKFLMLKGSVIDFTFWDSKKIGLVYDHVMSYYFWSETLDGNLLGAAYDPLIGSVNHACNPNAVSRILPDRVLLIAARDLKIGEELTCSYFFACFGIFDGPALDLSVRVNCGFNCVCDAHTSDVPHFSPGRHIEELEGMFAGCEKNDIGKRLDMLWSRCKDHRALIPGSEEFDSYAAFKLGYHMLVNSKQIGQGFNPEIGLWAALIMKYASEQNTVNLAPKIMANWECFKYQLLLIAKELAKSPQGKRESSGTYLDQLKQVLELYVSLKKLLLERYGNKRDLVEQLLTSSTFFLEPVSKVLFEGIVLATRKEKVNPEGDS